MGFGQKPSKKIVISVASSLIVTALAYKGVDLSEADRQTLFNTLTIVLGALLPTGV